MRIEKRKTLTIVDIINKEISEFFIENRVEPNMIKVWKNIYLMIEEAYPFWDVLDKTIFWMNYTFYWINIVLDSTILDSELILIWNK